MARRRLFKVLSTTIRSAVSPELVAIIVTIHTATPMPVVRLVTSPIRPFVAAPVPVVSGTAPTGRRLLLTQLCAKLELDPIANRIVNV